MFNITCLSSSSWLRSLVFNVTLWFAILAVVAAVLLDMSLSVFAKSELLPMPVVAAMLGEPKGETTPPFAKPGTPIDANVLAPPKAACCFSLRITSPRLTVAKTLSPLDCVGMFETVVILPFPPSTTPPSANC